MKDWELEILSTMALTRKEWIADFKRNGYPYSDKFLAMLGIKHFKDDRFYFTRMKDFYHVLDEYDSLLARITSPAPKRVLKSYIIINGVCISEKNINTTREEQ